jgi:hypothetical protein
MRVILGGERWTRRLVNRLRAGGELLDGDCDYDAKTIRLRRGQTDREELESDLHESLHAQFPWLREWLVDRSARELTVLLFDRLGYRKIP